jgi:hypothetical protein
VYEPLDEGRGEERDADHAVHREERGVEFEKSSCFTSECSYKSNPAVITTPVAKKDPAWVPVNVAAPTAARQSTVVTCSGARDEQCASRTERRGDRVKAQASIEFDVLEGVEHIEAGTPRRDPSASAMSIHHGSLHAPVTARYPPTGAIDMPTPSTRWHQRVKRFVKL